jgi:polar amino acid transport system substrate-binding protein
VLIDRRRCLQLLAGLPLLAGGLAGAAGEGLARVRQKGRLRVAIYNDFAPYSTATGAGIDAEIARAIAERLGLKPEIVGFNADEDMNDDLRNMVWKGHYLGTQPADVMMHVPVDEHLMKANDKVRIFGPYHREQLAVARNPARVETMSGSAAVALEVFTREKVGVEIATLADSFLLGVMNGRLRDNVVHFKGVGLAAKALAAGEVSAVFGPRGELESALRGETRFPVEVPQFAELKFKGWLLGMAVKAEEDDLAGAIVGALDGLMRDGTVAEIFKRHGVTHLPG